MSIIRALEETMGEIVRSEVEAAGLSEWDIHMHSTDCLELDLAKACRLSLTRGIGREMEFYARDFSVPNRLLIERKYDSVLELFRDEARFLCWTVKRGKTGLIVGRVGKLRLFKRSAAIAVKAAA